MILLCNGPTASKTHCLAPQKAFRDGRSIKAALNLGKITMSTLDNVEGMIGTGVGESEIVAAGSQRMKLRHRDADRATARGDWRGWCPRFSPGGKALQAIRSSRCQSRWGHLYPTAPLARDSVPTHNLYPRGAVQPSDLVTNARGVLGFQNRNIILDLGRQMHRPAPPLGGLTCRPVHLRCRAPTRQTRPIINRLVAFKGAMASFSAVWIDETGRLLP